MATNYSEIYELFLANVQDYLIDRAYAISTSTGETYIKPFLIRAIPKFDNCTEDLDDRNDTTQIFTATLTTKEKVILSDFMTVEWLRHEINDILQMKNHLNDTDFKTYSASQNLKEKKELLITFREMAEQDKGAYSYKNADWDTIWNV